MYPPSEAKTFCLNYYCPHDYVQNSEMPVSMFNIGSPKVDVGGPRPATCFSSSRISLRLFAVTQQCVQAQENERKRAIFQRPCSKVCADKNVISPTPPHLNPIHAQRNMMSMCKKSAFCGMVKLLPAKTCHPTCVTQAILPKATG